MSLTTRIQDQKDHITQVKKDLCSKVGIPSEPLPSFSEIMGSVPSLSLSDIIKFDIPETYQDGVSYNFQAFNRPWVKICGPNQLITEINYTSSRKYFTLEAIHNLITGKTKTRVSQPFPSVGGGLIQNPSGHTIVNIIWRSMTQIHSKFNCMFWIILKKYQK